MKDPTKRFAGLDWATDAHQVCVVDADGTVLDEFSVPHSGGGLTELCRRLGRLGADRLAIERPDGPVVEALLEAHVEVVVITSRTMKELRSRYSTSGAKSDRADAYVLADVLRTDGHRFHALEPDTPATVTLRGLVRARKDLVETRVHVANQLRAHLQMVFPGAVGLFRDVDSPISLAFLRRFPSETRAAWLSERRLAAWLTANHYCGRKAPAVLYARLAAAARGTVGDEADARASITLAFVEVLTSLRSRIDELTARIEEALEVHPDAKVFTSLPRAGVVRAAALLAEIGDCRARFPDPDALCALAGVVPKTSASGKFRSVGFRWAADKKLREALCDFAGDSWQGNEWARARYRELRKTKTHPHAERILARSWALIIWRCWQDGVPYNPEMHGGHRRLVEATA
jgi:transposase